MKKQILCMVAMSFGLGLAGIMACSSDPNSGGGGCGGMMGGAPAAPAAPISCGKGTHSDDGKTCISNSACKLHPQKK